MKKNEWSASLICANFETLKDDLQILKEFDVSYLHIDIMDGIFVPRFGMYPEMVKKIKNWSSIPIEVHLMIQNPENYIETFIQAGADLLTVHVEIGLSNLSRILEKSTTGGAKAGLALNPETDFGQFEHIQDLFNYLLVMGVDPGTVGQKIKTFIPKKINKYKTLLSPSKKIILDGGVSLINFQDLFTAGADILVGGSQTIFKDSDDLSENLSKIALKQNNSQLHSSL